MTDEGPSPFRGRRFTISRVMIDVLVADCVPVVTRVCMR